MDQTIHKPKKSKKKLVVGLMILIVLLASCLAVVSFGYYKEINRKLTSQEIQEIQDKEVGVLLEQVAKHILLPKNQDPSIATIVDAEVLKSDNLFFLDAEDGFKIIIYSDRAILFDPTNDIIVNVGPVQTEPTAEQFQQDRDLFQEDGQSDKEEEEAEERSDVEENGDIE